MVRLILGLLKQPFVLIQQVIISLLYAIPSIFGLLLATAGASLKLTAEALRTAFRGLSETADNVSREWTHRAILDDFPYLWQRQLKGFLYAISILSIIGIWLMLLFIPGIVVSVLILFRN